MLDEASRDLTTFSEVAALYRFKRMPFGLSCSAAAFARKLAEVLTPLRKKNWVRNYQDDITVYAPSYDDLLKQVDQLLTQHELSRD